MPAGLGYAPSRLYRPDGLWPVADILDIILLLDQTGPVKKYNSSFFQVAGIEPVMGLGNHGTTIIWTDTSVPAGYSALPSGAVSGHISAAGGVSQKSSPITLQQNPRTLLQARFLLRPIGLSSGGFGASAPHPHDIDVTAFLPGAVARWSVANQQGVLNMAYQSPLPADVAAGAVQGAAQALPTLYPLLEPWKAANLTEMFIFEQQGPSFVITNNGGSATTGGSLGVMVFGYRYDLVPLIPDSKRWVARNVFGNDLLWPADKDGRLLPVVPVPTAASVPQSQ